MASKSLSFLLFGEDKGAGGMFNALGDHATSTSGHIKAAFGAMGTAVGGELGGMIGTVAGAFDGLGEHASKGAKMVAGGAALTGLGAGLMTFGSGAQQSTAQLNQAITDSGHSVEEYDAKIEAAVKSMENYGHSSEDTKAALQKMTQATNDPAKALANMGLVANLAAAQHISLSDAATLVDKVMSGKGGKTLAQYGIVMAKLPNAAADAAKALRGHEVAVNQLASAQDKYKLLQDQLSGKAHITLADEDKLTLAHQKVIAAQDLVKLSAEKMAKAHAEVGAQGDVAKKALTELAGKIAGPSAPAAL